MKKLSKILWIFFLFCIVAIISADISTRYFSGKYISQDIQKIQQNKVWLLLGTSKYISDGRRNLFYLYRIEAAKNLYNAGKIEYILVSGDNSTKKYNETDTMKADLMQAGIPEEKIYGDYAGFRTLDSVVRAKEIFGQESFTLISQEFHLQRAIMLAKLKGVDAIWYPAKDVPVSISPRVWIRERLARVKMYIDILIWKKPKFWGEKIEIL